jgi:hypothetical protein
MNQALTITRHPRVPLGAQYAFMAAALAAGLALTLSAMPAQSAPIREAASGDLVNVQVLVDGYPTPLFVRPGSWDRTYFQAFKGKNYSLAVTNTTGERVGVLITVDGLNVVNGQKSSLANDEAMYVLDPYESATIRGWRTSLNDIRRFVFVDEDRSYASRTDQANGDMGWIRVLSFREQRRITWYDGPGYRDRSDLRGDDSNGRREPRAEGGTSKQSPPMDAPAPSGDLRAQKSGERMNIAPQSESAPGTGWGSHGFDPVRRTEFTAVGYATDHLVLRYEYESGLRALGIFPRRSRVLERERGELGFAQPPRW